MARLPHLHKHARVPLLNFSLPSADRLLDAITSFETALTWPEAQQRIQNVLQRGLQRDSDFETRWPEVLGTLLET